jgi:heat shock protein HtpX
MVFVLVLLALVYAAFVAALVLLLKSVAAVVVVVAGLLALQYWFSDKVALFAMRAHLVSADEEPRLHGAVDRFCALADMPNPVWPCPRRTCPTPSPPAAARTTRSCA